MSVNGVGLYNSEWLKCCAIATNLARKHGVRYMVQKTHNTWVVVPSNK